MEIAMNDNNTATPKAESFLFLTPLTLPWPCWELGQALDSALMSTWLAPFLLLAVIPLLDCIIGQAKENPPDSYNAQFSKQILSRLLPTVTLPCWILLAFWSVPKAEQLSLAPWIGWLLTMSFVASICLINVAHELVHRNTKFERLIGGLLLATVWNLTFKIEHIRGHHREVATESDHSTSKLGQNIYAFIIQAMLGNITRAWALETSRLKAQQKSWLYNEIIWFGVFSTSLTVVIALNFGLAGIIFYLCLAALTNALLEVINFIEHYGLTREQENGAPEPVNIQHAWNSNYRLSNALLLNLQRHSDHHMHAGRPYTALRHLPQSPQLPYGYSAMISLALIPPVWRAVMDPRVKALHKKLKESEISKATQ